MPQGAGILVPQIPQNNFETLICIPGRNIP